LRFRGHNNGTDVLTYSWFIDNVKVVATDTIPDDAVGAMVSDGLRLYPNPVKDQLHIDSKTTIRQMTLITVNGEMVENKKVDANSLDYPVVGLAKGNYMLRLVTDEGVVTKKIVLSE